jgi:hypothetical protein
LEKEVNRVPPTPSKKGKFEKVSESVIGYMTLLTAAYGILEKKKRGNPKLLYKLQVEISLLSGLLQNIFELDVSYIQSVVDRAHKDPDFLPEAGRYADMLAPPAKLIITPDDFAKAGGKFTLTGIGG